MRVQWTETEKHYFFILTRRTPTFPVGLHKGGTTVIRRYKLAVTTYLIEALNNFLHHQM